MSLMEQTKNAAKLVSKYRSPDILDWVRKVDPILEALGQPTIGGDYVDIIDLYEGVVTIQTFYRGRGCTQRNDIYIPFSILEAEDPIKAAKILRLKSKHNKTAKDLSHHTQMVSAYMSELAAIETELTLLESDK